MSLFAGFRAVRQLGYVVQDIDRAIDAWMDTQGVGPWTLFRHVPLQATYRGQQVTPVIDIALGYLGDMQIELIQPLDNVASPYRAMHASGVSGLHHVACLSDDIAADVERAVRHGHELVCDIRMPDGARYVYTQIPAMGEGVYFEYLQHTDRMRMLFAQGIAAASAWQGDRQVTVFDFRQHQ